MAKVERYPPDGFLVRLGGFGDSFVEPTMWSQIEPAVVAADEEPKNVYVLHVSVGRKVKRGDERWQRLTFDIPDIVEWMEEQLQLLKNFGKEQET